MRRDSKLMIVDYRIKKYLKLQVIPDFRGIKLSNWSLSHSFVVEDSAISQGHPIYSRICDEYLLNVTGFPVDESRTWVNPSCVYTCDYARGNGGTKRAVDAPEIVKNRGDLSLIDDRTSPWKMPGTRMFFSSGESSFLRWRRETLIANA